ncbi:MAG TPA: Lrp/AsnC family transcriptional regulator [Clostridia bacterium]|nr:Lrp/AsnC family transcriptional regulator [Clostridia bacterium]
MDSIDFQIIDLLQQNARTSLKKMAETVSLTPPAVSERIRKLEASGVITGYRAVINPDKVGFAIRAVINVTISREIQNDFVRFAKTCKNIIKCHRVTGEYSMSLEAVFHDMTELDTIVGKIQRYGDTQTLLILSSAISFRPLVPHLEKD